MPWKLFLSSDSWRTIAATTTPPRKWTTNTLPDKRHCETDIGWMKKTTSSWRSRATSLTATPKQLLRPPSLSWSFTPDIIHSGQSRQLASSRRVLRPHSKSLPHPLQRARHCQRRCWRCRR
ncbi:hypothetical protein EUGRSUZ_J00829 [Eucalyptus grandis]|uniref:Uncharacterized protein n=2 Tax=Eucalyptus grandis TaxID=71139 RepID=A0ACC3J357_EUCGR|nr:hypothetical protein EUGRSUZ_J00829 [Eucalyptus grandis]